MTNERMHLDRQSSVLCGLLESCRQVNTLLNHRQGKLHVMESSVPSDKVFLGLLPTSITSSRLMQTMIPLIVFGFTSVYFPYQQTRVT